MTVSNQQQALLRKLYDDVGKVPEMKDFHAKLAVLQGALRPTSRTSGERLRDFQPTPPAKPPGME
jgi:hypothetical protein